ncbi:MAG: hypothetical protein NT085_00520 [candidate division SR1 bacterium]|nr:hypothetical protein [candidate division SR1 bacterium]
MTLDENILEASKQTKIIASNLLKEKNILKTLSLVGTPLIIGSYALDLMVDPDIDIVVQTNFPKKKAKEALDIFIEKETVQKYEFGDFVKFPRKNRPEGYIVNLRIEYEGIKREIEIWFLGNIDIYKKQLDTYKSKINEDNRLKILNAKQERNTLGQTKHNKSSIEIYDKILDIHQ